MTVICSFFAYIASIVAVAAFSGSSAFRDTIYSPRTKLQCTIMDNPVHDVWIVGAGTLGEKIMRQLKRQQPGLRIVAETRTILRHRAIHDLNCIPKLRGDRSDNDKGTARNVIITLPPSSVSNYTDELVQASSLWSGHMHGGKLIFTSSTAVYGDPNGEIMKVTEDSPTIHSSQRASIMINAEDVILNTNGHVVRLSGLYNQARGPHSYWLNQLKQRETRSDSETSSQTTSSFPLLEGNGNGVVCMLHYDDAAAAIVALYNNKSKKDVLLSDRSRRIFLASDDLALTRQEICEAALGLGASHSKSEQSVDLQTISSSTDDAATTTNTNIPKQLSSPLFSRYDSREGKNVDCSQTRRILQWQPRFKSLATYFSEL